MEAVFARDYEGELANETMYPGPRYNFSGPRGSMPDSSDEFNTLIQDIMYIIVSPAIAVFGCIGNIINLIILVRIRLKMKKEDGTRESGTHLGLILLALSDMLFCIATFPRCLIGLTGTMSLFEKKGFRLYYQTYATGFVTTFILTSTWITVAMATLRYIGICHPLKMRKFNSHTCAKLVYLGVTFCSIAFNLPAYWQLEISELEMGGDEVYYLIDIGPMGMDKLRGYIFQWFRAIFGIFIPAAILTFCNASLIQALRKSHRMRRQYRVHEGVSRDSNRITLMLIIIVMMFITLCFPSEVMDFCHDLVKTDSSRTELFLVIRSVANVLQVVNFAFNFVLYCLVNAQFRKVLKDMLTCNGDSNGFASNDTTMTRLSRRSLVQFNSTLLTRTGTVTSVSPKRKGPPMHFV